jgi:phage terminase large subunit-like protein
MVTSIIRGKNPAIRVLDVRASRGKVARAEPVFALYEAGRVFHVGEHTTLERQMISFNPEQGLQNDDRVDALVWALTAGIVDARAGFVV